MIVGVWPGEMLGAAGHFDSGLRDNPDDLVTRDPVDALAFQGETRSLLIRTHQEAERMRISFGSSRRNSLKSQDILLPFVQKSKTSSLGTPKRYGRIKPPHYFHTYEFARVSLGKPPTTLQEFGARYRSDHRPHRPMLLTVRSSIFLSGRFIGH